MASDEPILPKMIAKAKRGSGVPRMVAGDLPLHALPSTVEATLAAKAQLPMRHFKSAAAREASLLNLVKGTKAKGSRGSRGSDKSVPNKLPHGLTLRQEMFCQNVMSGMTHAQSYRDAYDCHNMKPAVVYQRAYSVASNPRVIRRMSELWSLREGRLSHTPTQLRLFVQERLMIEALKEDNPASVRVRAVELIGKIGRVSLFEQEKGEAQENQSVESILKRIAPLIDAGNALAKQTGKAETPSKSR